MTTRFEQWTRAKLGEYDERDGETWVTVTVPVDSVRHDPRADVIAALTPPRLPSASDTFQFEPHLRAALRQRLDQAEADLLARRAERGDAEKEKAPTVEAADFGHFHSAPITVEEIAPIAHALMEPKAEIVGVVHFDFETAIEGPLLDEPADSVPTVSTPMVVTDVDRERGIITVDGEPKAAPKRKRGKR